MTPELPERSNKEGANLCDGLARQPAQEMQNATAITDIQPSGSPELGAKLTGQTSAPGPALTRQRGRRKQKAEPVTPVAKEGVGGRFDTCDKLSLSIYSIIALHEAGELSEGQCVKLMNCGDRVSWRLLREKIYREMKRILQPDMARYGWTGWAMTSAPERQATATTDSTTDGGKEL